MKILKQKSRYLFFLLFIFLCSHLVYANNFFNENWFKLKNVIIIHKKSSIVFTTISLIIITGICLKKFVFNDAGDSGNGQDAGGTIDILEEELYEEIKENDGREDDVDSDKKKKVSFRSQDLDIGDPEGWKKLKELWTDDDLFATERDDVLKELSDAQKVELEVKIKKEKLDEIELKLYSKKKHLTDEEWQIAQQISREFPDLCLGITEMLKYPKKNIIRAAQCLDRIKKKLKEKQLITDDELERVCEAHRLIPFYYPQIGELLSHQKK